MRKLAKGASPFGRYVPELLLANRVLFPGVPFAAKFLHYPLGLVLAPQTKDFAGFPPC
jgi:hypothetical protein